MKVERHERAQRHTFLITQSYHEHHKDHAHISIYSRYTMLSHDFDIQHRPDESPDSHNLRTGSQKIDEGAPDVRSNTRRLAKGHILLAVLSFITANGCFTSVSRNDITIQLYPDYGSLESHS
jgi:hypothetical protein